MRRLASGLVLIHISVFLFGSAGLFVYYIHQSPEIIVLGRVFFASISLFVLAKLAKVPITLKKSGNYLLLMLPGIILAVHWYTFFESIRLSNVATGLLTYSTFPVFVTFLEPLYFRKSIKIRDLLLALLSFAGIAIIYPDARGWENHGFAVALGVISGFTFAILAVLNRSLVKIHGSLKIAFYQDFFATLLFLPLLFIVKPLFNLNDLWLLFILGVVFTAVSHSFFIEGMKSVNAKTASIIACMEPVYGILLAYLLLKEEPSWRILLGGVIIISAMIAASYKAAGNPTNPVVN